MYVHADRGASRATKTSVRATNVKHVDTRDTRMNHGRGHTEREVVNGPRVQDSALSLSPSLSFFLPSIDAASLFLRSSLCSSRWVPRWLHVLIFLYNRLASAREENPYKPIPVRVQCRCIRIFAYIMPPRSVPVFHPPSTPRFYRFYLSIYRPLPAYACTPILRSRYDEEQDEARGFAHEHAEREREGEVPESAHFGSPCL